MIFFDRPMLERYLEHDRVLKLMQSSADEKDREFTSHRWLLDSEPKRMIFDHMYGDLLFDQTPRRSVLDVGGGYTSLTRVMLASHDYRLLDIMAHDGPEDVRDRERACGREFWIDSDWLAHELDRDFDLIMANDLFPNVDQRLVMFLEKYLPRCREMRLMLTYHNSRDRWYKVKRTDADEIFHMAPWTGRQIALALAEHLDRIKDPDLEKLEDSPPSLYANNRLVCLTTLRGGLA